MEPWLDSDRSGVVLDGKWRLERKIGAGGMGSVYAAVHMRTHKRVAVKILRSHFNDRDALARFQREGYVSNLVDDPGVVAVFDDGMADTGAYLVMELLEGESVEDRANRQGGMLPVREVLQLVHAALVVLAKAHARGVVHRDLKPSNLFIVASGQLKLLDFGLAGITDRPELRMTTARTPMMGTLGFMPPEQAQGDWARVGAASDIWAMGATMFALLTGRCVHEDETSNAQFLKKAMLDPAPAIRSMIPWLPASVAMIVDRALAFEIGARYADAGEMARDVDAALAAIDDDPLSSGEAATVPNGVALGDVQLRGAAPAVGRSAPAQARVLDSGPTLDEPPEVLVTAPSGASPRAATMVQAGASVGGEVALTREPAPRATSPGRGRWPLVLAVGALLAAAGASTVWWLGQRSTSATDGETAAPSSAALAPTTSADARAVATMNASSERSAMPIVTLSELPPAPHPEVESPPRASSTAPPAAPATSAAKPVATATATAAATATATAAQRPVDLDRRH